MGAPDDAPKSQKTAADAGRASGAARPDRRGLRLPSHQCYHTYRHRGGCHGDAPAGHGSDNHDYRDRHVANLDYPFESYHHDRRHYPDHVYDVAQEFTVPTARDPES